MGKYMPDDEISKLHTSAGVIRKAVEEAGV